MNRMKAKLKRKSQRGTSEEFIVDFKLPLLSTQLEVSHTAHEMLRISSCQRRLPRLTSRQKSCR